MLYLVIKDILHSRSHIQTSEVIGYLSSCEIKFCRAVRFCLISCQVVLLQIAYNLVNY